MNGSTELSGQLTLRQPQLSIVPLPTSASIPHASELPVSIPTSSVPLTWAQAPGGVIITTHSSMMGAQVSQSQPMVVNTCNAPVLLPSTCIPPQSHPNTVVAVNGPYATTSANSETPLRQHLNGSDSLALQTDMNSVIVSQQHSFQPHQQQMQQTPTLINGTIPINASFSSPSLSLPPPTLQTQQQQVVVTTHGDLGSRPTLIFNTKSLMELVKETDPHLQLDEETEEALTMMSEEFVESVAKQSVKLATHRGSPVVEAKDIKFCLDRDWNVFVPGFPTVEKNFKRPFMLQVHKQRLAMCNKQLKRT